jgi:hypothetical protein
LLKDPKENARARWYMVGPFLDALFYDIVFSEQIKDRGFLSLTCYVFPIPGYVFGNDLRDRQFCGLKNVVFLGSIIISFSIQAAV